MPHGIWSQPSLTRSSHQGWSAASTTLASECGKYTQGDRYLQPSYREPNQYGYARENPVRIIDSLGLFAIDSSCDCPARNGNIAEGVAKACSYARRPACANLLRKLGLGLEHRRLDRCLAERCSDATPIKCNNTTTACGSYSGLSHTIYLFRGHGGCPNQQGFGYGPTIFHEAIHSCDLFQEPYRNEPLSQAFNDIMVVCTGYNER